MNYSISQDGSLRLVLIGDERQYLRHQFETSYFKTDAFLIELLDTLPPTLPVELVTLKALRLWGDKSLPPALVVYGTECPSPYSNAIRKPIVQAWSFDKHRVISPQMELLLDGFSTWQPVSL